MMNEVVKSGQLSKVIMSFLGGNKELENAYLTGAIGVELCPQGTLAERIRAGGAGLSLLTLPRNRTHGLPQYRHTCILHAYWCW